MINLEYISLLDIVPDNLKQDEQVKAASLALDTELKNVSSAIKLCLLLPRLAELPESILDLLAWQYHVDFYEPIGMHIEKKRELIRKSIDWHRHKGTPYAVEQVVSAAISDAVIQEWFDYGGAPGTFRIKTSGFKEEGTYKELIKSINSAKNTRSHLDRIIIELYKNIFDEENQLRITIGSVNLKTGRKKIGVSVPPAAEGCIKTGTVFLKSGKKTINIAAPEQCRVNLTMGTLTRRIGRVTIGGKK